MYIEQRNYIYFPDNQNFEKCPGFAESQKIEKNGTRMYYTDLGSETLVVYYHGNSGSACGRAFIKDKFHEKGISSLVVEYSGYSGEEKEPSKSLILEDVKNADSFLDNLSYDTLSFMGGSLGTGIAAYHTTIRSPDKFIAVSAFDKLSSVAKEHYPFLPVSFLLKEEYKTTQWLRDFKGEALFLHGSKDETIPKKYGRRVYESLNVGNKNFVEIEGENHNTILNSEKLWSEVFKFLD